ncbi:MAG: hypothetical protein A3H06_00560 [Candidatus Colwellbacteria bacterium RIFCSPLOWO2_12_FULL_44_13]|uniref:Type II secretion system protein J n=3 Tax=Candidatus Colwelliibacteriota TaxID=1817904 RepID=A0A1G1Z6C4_9BACT|nr:MAG: hypothetical protein A3F24_03005 [Candidatus Colwellbacteria bacterium RIFCSPHIGHO2_12_FULL_44_17]OGY59440.1 MAG: hypothetical protein A3I31_00235 [Candidatus Colwellbacteria bacterium RIFCSPLOWO2_02_FULL_44_20b]OGY61747.1 MAG: hypothetical protein A3H06_00560 [Candidatus Colwellbacteria bacterium RIFCSPLOWO2_12_FULL_44_13]
MRKNKRKKEKAFTTVELLVAISLFIILITLAAATFFQAIRIQNTVVKLVASNDNAAQIMEQIAREIRTGVFTMPEDPSGVSVIGFTNARQEYVQYKWEDNAIKKCKRIVGVSCNNQDFKRITSENTKVTNLRFILKGTGSDDHFPPRVTILTTFEGPNEISFHYQTTVSARTMGN